MHLNSKGKGTFSKFTSPISQESLKEFYINEHIEGILESSSKKKRIPEIFQGKYEQGLVEYLIQKDCIARYGHKRYVYTRKGFSSSAIRLDQEIRDVVAGLNTAGDEGHYIHINNLKGETIEAEDVIIVPVEALQNQTLLDDLKNALDDKKGGNPDATIILAFDDTATSIPNNFKLPGGLTIKNLVITGKLLESVGDEFLSLCRSLVSIILPEGLRTVGNGFLAVCRSLVSIILPEGLHTVGNSFLSDCSSLVSINLPEGLRTVGNYFLVGCSSLVSIILPERLHAVGNNFLVSCSSLVSIILPEWLS